LNDQKLWGSLVALDHGEFPKTAGWNRISGPRHRDSPMRPALIEYAEASPRVRAVFDDIMKTRGTDWVNNFWKGFAHDPAPSGPG
jgi:hypothetical protein